MYNLCLVPKLEDFIRLRGTTGLHLMIKELLEQNQELRECPFGQHLKTVSEELVEALEQAAHVLKN